MLQKIQYSTLDYGYFDKLRKKFLNGDFDPMKCRELELSHQHSPDLPKPRVFEIVTNLSVLILSHNAINRFDAKVLTKGTPMLEALDLSFNRIEVIDDIIDLGGLVHLKILEFSNNPIANRLSRINTIIELFYPEKYKKYDPVKVLTAGYQQHPRTRLTHAEEEQMKKDLQVQQRFNEELEDHEMRNTVSKYNHKNTLAKYAVEPCPVPRKCRFKNLEYLNGQIVTKLDMMRASGKDKIKDIIEDVQEDKIEVKRIHRNNPVTHKKYLDKYFKRITKMNEENQHTDMRSIKMASGGVGSSNAEGGNAAAGGGVIGFGGATNAGASGADDRDPELEYLSKVDSALAKAASMKIDPKKFAADIWQTPLDMIYKDSTFQISMKSYKKMLHTYDVEKKQKEEKRKLKQENNKLERRNRVYKKLLKAGIQPVSDEEMKKYFEDYDSENENPNQYGKRRMHRKQPREIEEKEYSSSESDMSERMQERKDSSSSDGSQSSFFKYVSDSEDENSQLQQQEEDKQKNKKKLQQQQHAEVDVLELKKRIDNTKLKNQAQNSKKPFHANASKPKQPMKKEEDLKPNLKTLPPAAAATTTTNPTQSDLPAKTDANQSKTQASSNAQVAPLIPLSPQDQSVQNIRKID